MKNMMESKAWFVKILVKQIDFIHDIKKKNQQNYNYISVIDQIFEIYLIQSLQKQKKTARNMQNVKCNQSSAKIHLTFYRKCPILDECIARKTDGNSEMFN